MDDKALQRALVSEQSQLYKDEHPAGQAPAYAALDGAKGRLAEIISPVVSIRAVLLPVVSCIAL